MYVRYEGQVLNKYARLRNLPDHGIDEGIDDGIKLRADENTWANAVLISYRYTIAWEDFWVALVF